MTAIPRHAIVSATSPDIFRLSAPSGRRASQTPSSSAPTQRTAASTHPSTDQPPISTTGSASATTTAPVIVGIRRFGTGRGVEKAPATR